MDTAELLDLALTPRQTRSFEAANAAPRISDQQLLVKTSVRQEASELLLPSRDDFALCRGARIARSVLEREASVSAKLMRSILSFLAETQILSVCCPADELETGQALLGTALVQKCKESLPVVACSEQMVWILGNRDSWP